MKGGPAPSLKAAPRIDAAGGALGKRDRDAAAGISSSADVDAKRRKHMSDGTVAGMVSGREVVEEMERKRAVRMLALDHMLALLPSASSLFAAPWLAAFVSARYTVSWLRN